MTYKTILVHVDQSRHAAQRIRIAAHIAHAEDAHLIGTATTDSDNAAEALARFDAMAADAGVTRYEKRLADAAPGAALSQMAPYSDLVVITQADPVNLSASDLAEFVMINCARPVLIIPYAGTFTRIWQQVLVAWDGSMEATRALAGALPLLRRADRVTVALFNPPAKGERSVAAGADIALYLARHGVSVELLEQKVHYDVGNALLTLAAEIDADLLVMGGYGHSRLRETLFGGVTSTVLNTMTIPVLMAH